jgi:hypothetical protein
LFDSDAPISTAALLIGSRQTKSRFGFFSGFALDWPAFSIGFVVFVDHLATNGTMDMDPCNIDVYIILGSNAIINSGSEISSTICSDNIAIVMSQSSSIIY